jgi:hypothetical protein
MIDQFDAAEIRSRLSRGLANFLFIAEHCYPCQSLSRGGAGGHDGARIFPFGKNDMLRVRSCALSDVIENGHGRCQ